MCARTSKPLQGGVRLQTLRQLRRIDLLQQLLVVQRQDRVNGQLDAEQPVSLAEQRFGDIYCAQRRGGEVPWRRRVPRPLSSSSSSSSAPPFVRACEITCACQTQRGRMGGGK